jgi:signal transduction histidine kinase
MKYEYMLENYDNIWHDASTNNNAYFFSVPPGHYTFRVRAISTDGTWSEKALAVTVLTPWWLRWWAFVLYALLLVATIWSFAYYRSRSLRREKRLLEHKVKQRTEEVMQQKEEIAAQRDNLEQTLEELKAAQTQLVQKEKMASLGELTAGIAHEIQNPLNFVNNFSEVNRELIVELKQEARSGNTEEVLAIADNIEENEQKIAHHGKRADSIVKGMLQHSRNSSGIKQPTDLNALAEEYLRLSYHGFRAKDKSFNASIITHYDDEIDKINIVAEDMGRVLLNLYNNAFYSTIEKKKTQSNEHEPTVIITTKRENNKVVISVKDNGIGIPQKIIDKVFQPFFTTRPAGQGTGLGLSISYDIVKAHRGEIKVEAKEGEGATFIVLLPVGQ